MRGLHRFLGVSNEFPCLRPDHNCPGYNRHLFLDFSTRLLCDRLSVDIMNDRFTLISKLIGIVVIDSVRIFREMPSVVED